MWLERLEKTKKPKRKNKQILAQMKSSGVLLKELSRLKEIEDWTWQICSVGCQGSKGPSGF